VPLVGGHIHLDPNDPYRAAYCVSSGDFGPKPLASADATGRTFLFRATSVTMGSRADGGATGKIDCSGAPMGAAAAGCIYRTSTWPDVGAAVKGRTAAQAGRVVEMGLFAGSCPCS
jgi:hypothetical protein